MLKYTPMIPILALLMSCDGPRDELHTRPMVVHHGDAAIFVSNQGDAFLVLYPEERLALTYFSFREIGTESDIGGDMPDCSDGSLACWDIGGKYIMVPRCNGASWQFGEFHFSQTVDDREPGSVFISVFGPRNIRYSYQYNNASGVGFIDFQRGGDRLGEVFYAIGSRLFHGEGCWE